MTTFATKLRLFSWSRWDLYVAVYFHPTWVAQLFVLFKVMVMKDVVDAEATRIAADAQTTAESATHRVRGLISVNVTLTSTATPTLKISHIHSTVAATKAEAEIRSCQQRAATSN
jgi:hypothetical protein